MRFYVQMAKRTTAEQLLAPCTNFGQMRITLLFGLLLTCAAHGQAPLPTLIPMPAQVRMEEGVCRLDRPWRLQRGSQDVSAITALLGEELSDLGGQQDTHAGDTFSIDLQLVAFDTLLPAGYHSVVIRESGVTIIAPDAEGLFQGSRTLIQLLDTDQPSIPCATITDHPRFQWRGMHLDVCRHFFPVEFVKKYIDLLARYKMNTFHWHLTDDQGWRIEIKKYPKLTEIGSWRSGSQVGPYGRREYDSISYGGYYTQEQIREVVAYAAARHITVVPEIEMPGHAMAALAAYPELGCTGGPYEVQKGWGVFEDVLCAGNDSVFSFMQNVLTEVMELFPSEIIHIGGDECPKESWKKCPKCQSRMKAEGLKDEHALQSYFILRIEKFVNSKGRKIIGWDEILEGGLAPNAAVMSWRGTEGGIAAAKSGHYAVMSPGSHCYFDHYQGDPANEPLAIGGYTTVQKVYSYEPIPAELNAEQAKYILGAQGNVWTEYILTPEHVEYMALPRMLALAEVLWTPKEKRNEADFIRRMEKELSWLEAMNVNASKSLYQVRFKLSQGRDPGTILVRTPYDGKGGVMVWQEPEAILAADGDGLTVRSDAVIKAHGYLGGGPAPADTSTVTIKFNKATAQKVTLSEPPNERYNEGGAFTLVDGITAQDKRVNTEWLGWRKSVTITVDLGSVQEINYLGIGALNETHSWIHLPEKVDFLTSPDGKTFIPYGTRIQKSKGGRVAFGVEKVGEARYVRFAVKHSGNIPEGFPGAGDPAWLFLDEVEVR
jgi:hexosaminidase